MSNYETERKELRKQVELFHAYEALKQNPNFRKLILGGFCIDEVIRLNRLANQQVNTEARIATSQQAQAAPVLEAYLNRVQNDGEIAREKIPELDALIAQQSEEEPEN